MSKLISGGGTVMAGAGNTSNAGIVVNASTLDIAAGSALAAIADQFAVSPAGVYGFIIMYPSNNGLP